MESKMLLIAFVNLIFIAEGAVTDYNGRVPKHCEHTEKFSCVNKLDVFLDRCALYTYSSDFLGSWPGNNNFDCRTTVFSKTKNTGIIAVIQAMKFRKVSESCRDYVRLEGDGTKCGDIVFGLQRNKRGNLPPPPEFISAFSGLFVRGSNQYMENSPGSSVDSRKRFWSPGGVVTPSYTFSTELHVHSQPALEYEEGLQFAVAYTGFQDCEDTKLSGQMFNCGYGVCILDIFVNDGVVNCPFGDCRDEGGCDNALRTSLLIMGESNVTGADAATASVGQPGVTKSEKEETKGTAHHPASIPMAYALQVPSARGDLGDIGEELRVHNHILEKISSLLERGVVALEEGGAKGNAREGSEESGVKKQG